LRLALLDGIRAAVAFDAYAWLLADPETEVGAAPLADVPCLAELPATEGLPQPVPRLRSPRASELSRLRDGAGRAEVQHRVRGGIGRGVPELRRVLQYRGTVLRRVRSHALA
jgi:hypothetical protein